MAAYTLHFSTLQTLQSEPIPESDQVPNSAGGFAWGVDDWTRLDRFLILGSEGGSYYASERKLTIENGQAVLRCARSDGKRTVARIVQLSESGRAPRNDPAIFALAICAGEKIPEALAAIPKVCRIGTHLFQFAEYAKAFRGRGRAFNRALGDWYKARNPQDVAYQLVKYQQRNGWSHRDIFRLVKPKAAEPLNSAIRWVVGKMPEFPILEPMAPLAHISAFEQAKKANKHELVRLIRDYNMPREAIPTQFLAEPEVWEALLERMPLTAMVRNLATMTRIGLLKPMSIAINKVLGALGNAGRIKDSRLHPLAILLALKTYASGRGDKSKNTWQPVPQIIDALDTAFYLGFSNVAPTGKRWMLGCDVSGSMSIPIAGTILACREAVGALAMVTARTEPNYHIMAFSHGLVPVNISRSSRLDNVIQAMSQIPMGGTDCALPILYAFEQKIPVDIFVILTDSETWAGNIHPSQALVKYRQKMGINAKLVVMGMASNGFTIADPNDAGMMDVVGFDAAVPEIMADFATH